MENEEEKDEDEEEGKGPTITTTATVATMRRKLKKALKKDLSGLRRYLTALNNF